jgi:hypothetical protein
VNWNWVATFPSTNGKIVVSLGCVLLTCGRVVILGWTPPMEWLGFLALMLGLDTAHFYAKRTTEFAPTSEDDK